MVEVLFKTSYSYSFSNHSDAVVCISKSLVLISRFKNGLANSEHDCFRVLRVCIFLFAVPRMLHCARRMVSLKTYLSCFLNDLNLWVGNDFDGW